MGDDTALPPLSGRGRPLPSYFRQRFAQVTNPAIDHIRERFVMSLGTLLGARAPLLLEVPEAASSLLFVGQSDQPVTRTERGSFSTDWKNDSTFG